MSVCAFVCSDYLLGKIKRVLMKLFISQFERACTRETTCEYLIGQRVDEIDVRG